MVAVNTLNVISYLEYTLIHFIVCPNCVIIQYITVQHIQKTLMAQMKMLERPHELRSIGQNSEIGERMKKHLKSWKSGLTIC